MSDETRNDLLMRLLDQFEHYYRTLSADDPNGRRSFEEIAGWFESRDTGDPGTFESICRRLDFDAESIRVSLARRTAEIGRGRVPVRSRKA
jgi:hypothetical protein